MDTQALEGIGLTRNESIIYLTLLESGKSGISRISEKTRMHRRTIYDCLERLQDRGLVSFVIEGKTRFFIPAQPGKIKDIIKEKEQKIDDFFPRLMELAGSAKVQTEVSVHKGKEGLKNAMEQAIKDRPKVIFDMTSAGKAITILPYYTPQFHEKRIKSKILLKIIGSKSIESLKRSKELEKMRYTEVRHIDSKFITPISIWTFNNKVVFLMWESELGIIIENKETAATFRNYFSMIWNSAK